MATVQSKTCLVSPSATAGAGSRSHDAMRSFFFTTLRPILAGKQFVAVFWQLQTCHEESCGSLPLSEVIDRVGDRYCVMQTGVSRRKQTFIRTGGGGEDLKQASVETFSSTPFLRRSSSVRLEFLSKDFLSGSPPCSATSLEARSKLTRVSLLSRSLHTASDDPRIFCVFQVKIVLFSQNMKVAILVKF